MKRKKDGKTLAVLYAVLSALLIVGPRSLFAVCAVEEKPMKCYWSTQAVTALAIILLAVAVLFFLADSAQVKAALSIVTIVTAAMVILIPARLIGGCGMMTMACRRLTFPAFYVIGILFLVSAVVEIVLLQKEKAGAKEQE
ncbi:MAG: DUF4418 family protein [Lachnospiraceae bacterium]|nr:DUF4418 family protein [Lachnospiraceae bacterium]